MEEINYDIKIQNFLIMTETGDHDIAIKYLESENWDETKAVNKFFESTSNNNSPSNNNNLDFSQNTGNNMVASDENRLNKNLINIPNNNSSNSSDLRINNIKKESICKKILYAPLNFLLDCCTERREVKKSEEKKVFHYLPNIYDDFYEFCQMLKNRIGIIIFYRGNNIPFLNNLISQICRSTISLNILKKSFIIYPILANTKEGIKTQDIITDGPFIFPSFVFCYNSSKYPSAILTRNHIINILETETITLNSFHNMLLETSKKLNINKSMSNNILNEIDKSFGPLTDAEILNQQNFDMEKLEKEAIKKEEQLKKEKKLEEEKRKEEANKLKEIEDKANEAKRKIVEEPEEGGPDTTDICFRYPDGEKFKNRRFLRSHTIQNLYDYITSLGEEIYTEKENNDFSLNQPFPPKKFDIMENTLEKEGLFPNAVIQIREE